MGPVAAHIATGVVVIDDPLGCADGDDLGGV